MNLAELFASVGYKVDEASIARFDAALDTSKKKTDDLTKSNDSLLEGMRVVEAARDREAADVSEFIRLYDKLIAKKIDASKAVNVVSLDQDKAMAARQEMAARSWRDTTLAISAGIGLITQGFNFVRGKIQGLLADLSAAGGRAGAIVDMSERTGIATDKLQELGYAAESNGSNLQDLAAGLRSISNKADAAAAGSKGAAKALRDVGISAKDLRSGQLSLDDALGKIADKFSTMEDGPKKAALAMDLLGGAGVKLIPMLNKGSAGLAQTREEARKLGVVLSKDTLASFDKLDDDTAKLKTTFQALKTQGLAAVVPAIQKLVDKAQAWFQQNRVKFVNALAAAFGLLATAMTAAAAVVEVAVEAFAFLSEHAEIVEFAVTALTAAMVIHKLATIAVTKASIAAAVASAAAWIAAAAPFIAIGLAIAAVIRYWPRIKAGAVAAARAIADAFEAAWQGIKDAFHYVIDGIKSTFESVIAWFTRKIDGIKDAFHYVIDGIKSTLESVIAWFTRKIDWIVDKWRSVRNFVFGGPVAASGVSAQAMTSAAVVPSSAQQTTSTTVIHSNSPIEINSTAPAPDVAKHARREFEAMWAQKLRQGGT